MRRILAGVGCLMLLGLVAGPVAAQGQQSPPTFEQVAVRAWNNVHNKVIAMAKDFPEDKYDSRPQKDARSFVEEVWHLTQGTEFFAAVLRGEQPDPQKFFGSYDGRPRTRAELAAQLEKGTKEVATLLEQKPTPRSIGWVEHAGEHYGKLVTIYRMNNLVPPASRN